MWFSPATFGSSSTSADEADDDDGSDTEEGTEVDIEALEEDELFVQNLGRNQETVGRTGDDYEVCVMLTQDPNYFYLGKVILTLLQKEESDGPSDSPQLKHKVTNDSNSGDDDCEEGDEDNEDEAGETASSSRS